MTSVSRLHNENPPALTTEAEILRLARDEPELGQAAVAQRLRQAGISISASGVRYIWQKHGLETTVKRLQALAGASAEGVAALTGNQRELLERGTLTAQLTRPSGDGHGEGAGDEPLDRRQIKIGRAHV